MQNYKIIDLTHALDENIPTWSGSCGFTKEILMDYESASQGFRIMNYKMDTGTGTHIDSPSHCVKNGMTVDQIPLEKLITNLYVIDVTQKAKDNSDYQITLQDLYNFEKQYGKISANSFIIGYTGWYKKWNNPKDYRNCENDKEFWKMHFPTFAGETAQFFLDRDVTGIGIDTLSPDTSVSGFPLHFKLLSANKFILENLTNLDKIPLVGAKIIILPLKIADGSEAPARVIALYK